MGKGKELKFPNDREGVRGNRGFPLEKTLEKIKTAVEILCVLYMFNLKRKNLLVLLSVLAIISVVGFAYQYYRVTEGWQASDFGSYKNSCKDINYQEQTTKHCIFHNSRGKCKEYTPEEKVGVLSANCLKSNGKDWYHNTNFLVRQNDLGIINNCGGSLTRGGC